MQTNPSADYRPLTLVPGVEISVKGGVRIRALFDPSKGRDDIIRLLDAVIRLFVAALLAPPEPDVQLAFTINRLLDPTNLDLNLV